MHSLIIPSFLQSHRLTLLAVAAVLLVVAGGALFAQVGGERGIAPVAITTDIEVPGIEVDVHANSGVEAREQAWREAQRIAWTRLDGPAIADSVLDSLVAAIVVEEERIGPRRYIARLGVIFDRKRAGGLLGGEGTQARSSPILILPTLVSGGTSTMFEVRNPWQRAWAEHQFGTSPIDYVRPAGVGGESLLLTYGQTRRRSRAWWGVILDEFGAADILVPVARLEYLWPGGPVEGHFTARHGPDNRFFGEFSMRADSIDKLPEMLDRAVARFDEMFTQALAQGTLRPDPTLTLDKIEVSPEIRALLEEALRAEDAERAIAAGETFDQAFSDIPPATQPVQAPVATAITVQAATPDPRSFDAALTGIRSLPGVRGLAVSSTAIGGTSVIRVDYVGDIAQLASDLRSTGWQVTEGNNALAMTR